MPHLLPHASSDDAARTLLAHADREGTELLLRFELTRTGGLVIPPPGAAPSRRDGLWRHTCLEAFVRPAGSEAYLEVNLSPSGDWAVYHFTGRRTGMESPQVERPVIQVEAQGPYTWTLRASIDLAGLLSPAVPWELALAAVLEDQGGVRSYWALAHPAEGPPDFHDPACFVLELTPPGAA